MNRLITIEVTGVEATAATSLLKASKKGTPAESITRKIVNAWLNNQPAPAPEKSNPKGK